MKNEVIIPTSKYYKVDDKKKFIGEMNEWMDKIKKMI